MPLRAVLFDLWETLIMDTPERSKLRRSWRSKAVQEVLASHGFDLDAESARSCLDAALTAITTLHEAGLDLGSESRAQLVFEKLQSGTGRTPPSSAVEELGKIVTSMPLDKAPLPTSFALEAVSALKAMGIGTALVCNAGITTAPHLRLMLEHYGLRPQLDILVFSDELKCAKPDRRMFAAALDGLGYQAADCAFVGDNPFTDIHGAQRAGLFAVLIGAKYRDGVTPDASIQALDELIPTLAACGRTL